MFKKIALYGSAALASFLVLIYLGIYRPEIMHDILISVDVIGVTQAGKEEKSRVAYINDIKDLTFERRQALIKRTVFIDATTEMVYLALGSPRQPIVNSIADIKATQGSESWVYFFPEDRRPTILEFNNNVLVKAYKGSSVDIQHIQNPHDKY